MRTANPPRDGEGEDWPLRFQLGARTLLSLRRRLHRIPLSLDQALAGEVPVLAPPAADGYLVTSLPEAALPALTSDGVLTHVRQRYRRWWVDLAAGEAAWLAGLSANARAQARRKAKRLGPHTVRRFATAAEVAAFHPLARAVSALTYQERLLDSGLPADPAPLVRLAAADRVRAWLLERDGAAIAYLCCTGEGDTLRYDHVGHDPAHAAMSPGSVLQWVALGGLFAEARWARFDFTEGEGQHKRQWATGGVPCVDLLLLRPTLANRALLAAVKGWDATVAWAKGSSVLRRVAAKLRR